MNGAFLETAPHLWDRSFARAVPSSRLSAAAVSSTPADALDDVDDRNAWSFPLSQRAFKPRVQLSNCGHRSSLPSALDTSPWVSTAPHPPHVRARRFALAASTPPPHAPPKRPRPKGQQRVQTASMVLPGLIQKLGDLYQSLGSPLMPSLSMHAASRQTAFSRRRVP